MQGCCCKNLSERYTSKNKEIVKQFNESGPMYILLNPDEITLPISCYEVLPLINIAKEKGIDFNPRPSNVLIDDKRKKVLVLMYDLGYADCPFLDKNNACSIYEDRPLICRTYPFEYSVKGNMAIYTANECVRVDRDYFNKSIGSLDNPRPVKETRQDIIKYFGKETFTYAMMSDILYSRQSVAIKYFIDNKDNPFFRIVRKPLRFMERKLSGFEFIPFNVFLRNVDVEEVKGLSFIADGKFYENLKNDVMDNYI